MYMIMAATAMVMTFMLVFSGLYQDNFNDKKRILMEDYGYALQNEFILAAKSKACSPS